MQSNKTFIENLDRLGAWGVITTDAALRVTGWNRWLEQRSGKPAAAVLGRHLFDLYPDVIARGLDRYYREALEGRACLLSQRFHKFLLPMPPSVSYTSLMHMQQTARLMPLMEQERITGTLTLIEDVTERIVTEDELRKQAERLEEAGRHKDDFLAMLAHELRNPLGPIRNGLHVLELVAGDSAEARQTRTMMARQVEHMARIVDDLLDVSRIARGKVRLRQEPCDLTTIVRDVVEDYRPLVEAGGIRLVLESSSEPAPVLGDGVRLAQVLGNLLNNAAKFTNSGGEIRVSREIHRPTKTVVVRVADTGIGMTRETLARIFDSFAQADSSLERSKGGLGLGLSLARGLANLHGGSLDAASEGADKGSVFTLVFPLTEATPATVTGGIDGVDLGKQSKRVLVIEDNADMGLSMKMLLTHLGYRTELATSGTAGVELARQLRPHIVLCDIGLPGRNGYEVARELRADPDLQQVYLIAQSGYGTDDDLRRSHDSGFDLHLVKPVDFRELQRVLAAVPGDRTRLSPR